MGKDFFDELGETIARTAKGFGERAGQVYEIQKLRGSLSTEERMVNKIKADMGNIIYRRYCHGEELDQDLIRLCQEIDQHMERVTECKDSIAALKREFRDEFRDGKDKSRKEEPAAEEPVAEEPAAEEPVTEEPVTEEPAAEESASEVKKEEE